MLKIFKHALNQNLKRMKEKSDLEYILNVLLFLMYLWMCKSTSSQIRYDKLILVINLVPMFIISINIIIVRNHNQFLYKIVSYISFMLALGILTIHLLYNS